MKIKKQIIPRDSHTVSRNDISNNALKVLYRLRDANFEAFLVGGGVRDLLLGEKPKDFDIATNAEPEEVKQLFRNCRLIGRRFRLAHILYGRDVIEVATFRGPHEAKQHINHAQSNVEGRIIRDNVFGTLEEDAVRRDFTVNALYYDIRDFSIIDFTQGLDDLKKRTLRLIGDTETRYREDTVRMLRAIRLAAKLDFEIDTQASQQIFTLGHLLDGIPVARLFDETIKMFQGGYGLKCFELLRQYKLFELLFPMSELSIIKTPQALMLIRQALINTDARIASGKSVNPAFFLAVLLWHPMHEYQEMFIERGQHDMEALFSASREVVMRQQAHTAIPKRFTLMMREIWHMQSQLQHPTRKRALKTLTNSRFRAAYDFLQLRVMVGDDAFAESYQWWTEIQSKDPETQMEMCNQLGTKTQKRSRRNRGNRRKKMSPQQKFNDNLA